MVAAGDEGCRLEAGAKVHFRRDEADFGNDQGYFAGVSREETLRVVPVGLAFSAAVCHLLSARLAAVRLAVSSVT